MPTEPARSKRPDCSMVTDFTGARCTATAVRWMQVGCVHEHIQIGAVCREHAGMLAEGNSLISCTACRQGGAPHRCKLIGREISNEEKRCLVQAMRASKEADRG